MLFIDANAFLAYYNVRDVNHARAVKLWIEIESGKYGDYFTSDYVFNEVVGFTFRKFGKESAVVLGKHILKNIFVLNVNEHLLADAWKGFVETKLQLNLVDCTNLVSMKFASAKHIATFDKEFEKVEGVKVVA